MLWLAGLGFLALALLAYFPGLHGGFVYDDWGSITGNPDVQVKTGALAEWWRAAIAFPSGTPPFRSLTMLTFAANHYFGGLDPFGFKLTNLAIHLVNGVLLFLALKALFALTRECNTRPESRDFDENLAAIAIAGLWLLLPINLTPVLYVVQRLESLAATFTFLGLWWYLRARQNVWRGTGGIGNLWASIFVCTALGVLAKETGVMLPLYAALIEFCVTRGRDANSRASRPVFALFACTLLVPFLIGLYWMWGRYFGGGIAPELSAFIVDRLMTEARVVVDYICWTLVPSLDSLTLYHDDIKLSHGLMDPPTTVACIVGLAAILGVAMWQRSRRPLFSLGIFWFFAGHILTATVVPLILAFEHRNYFPSAGLMLAVVSVIGLERPLLQRTRPRLAILAVAAVFYAATTWMRADEWSDPVRLATSEALKRPDSEAAQFDYAQALLAISVNTHSSAPAEAALKILDNARHLPGASIHFEQSMITLLAESGYAAPEEVWLSLIRKLQDVVPDTNAVHALARLNHCFAANQCKKQQLPMLERAYEAALSRSPVGGGLLEVHGEYAWHVLQDHERAEADYRAALRTDPRGLAAQTNLIVVLIYERKFDEAESLIQAMERRNFLGALDGFVVPLRATLKKLSVDEELPKTGMD